MQYQGYSYDVDTYDILPAIGGLFGYGGKAVRMRTPGGKPANFLEQEHPAKTRQEAFELANAAAKSWIDQQIKGA